MRSYAPTLILLVPWLLSPAIADDRAVKEELARHQGTWRASASVYEGREAPAEVVRSITRTVEGDHVVWKRDGKSFAGTRIELDPSRDPRTIDVIPDGGRDRGERVLGIYKLEGDRLTIGMAAPGKPRPSAFRADKGSGWTLRTFVREAGAARPEGGPFPVAIRVDASRPVGEMRPVWRFFGHDEPNYTTMPDGRKLLGQLAGLSPEPAYIRTHNLLTSGDGTPALKWGSTGVYSEDARGRPRYDWTILDRIFDTYKERGVRPYVQIGFMPEALSTHPVPYQHRWTPGGKESISTGWAYPPRDYEKWGELVFRWVRHAVERYGQAEVETWYWEVWNEPNILYWRGTPQEYHRLYDHAAAAVKRALPTARVGGPHVAGPGSPGGEKFLREFLDHCLHGRNEATGGQGAPLDFVAFHAKGNPRFVEGHVQTGIAAQLRDIDRGFEVVAGYPELKGKPVIIGESDPDGCAACPSSIYPQNGYRNGTLYASYTAAAFARKYALADRHGVNFEGAVTWAFEFEGQPYFAGFRVLATNGIPLPVLNVFRMFGLMGGRRLAVESSGEIGLEAIRREGARGRPDVSALASLRDGRLCVLAWYHHDVDVPGPSADVELTVSGLPVGDAPVLLEHFRIDREHSNAFEAWRRMGSPQNPTPDQRAELERASDLALLGSPGWMKPEGGSLTLRFDLPRQGVSLLVLHPSGDPRPAAGVR